MTVDPTDSVSLADVARHAGVSASTASKALNDRFDVSEATRARVESSARELGYSPNSFARGLGGGRTGTVGVITSDLDGRFAIPVLMGVEDALGADRVLTFLCDARGDDVREAQLVRSLVARRVEGIILVGNQTDVRPSIGALPMPVVYAYSMSDDDTDPSVTIDNQQVGHVAARHLIDSGRRRIIHISGEAPHSAAQLRLVGARAALAEDGLDFVSEPLFGDWSEGWGRAAAMSVLDRGDEIDAVLCGSDQIARGVLDTFRERGIDVPRDIAVMGIDNWTLLAANSRPSLSTVDLNLERIGRLAARQLFADSQPSGVTRVSGRVIIRDSTIPRS